MMQFESANKVKKKSDILHLGKSQQFWGLCNIILNHHHQTNPVHSVSLVEIEIWLWKSGNFENFPWKWRWNIWELWHTDEDESDNVCDAVCKNHRIHFQYISKIPNTHNVNHVFTGSRDRQLKTWYYLHKPPQKYNKKNDNEMMRTRELSYRFDSQPTVCKRKI